MKTAKEQVRLFWICAKYDLKSFGLMIQIAVIRLKTAVMKKATEVLQNEL